MEGYVFLGKKECAYSFVHLLLTDMRRYKTSLEKKESGWKVI